MNGASTHRGALPLGTRVEEFEFQEVLGHGGFGITYRGWDAVLHKSVAIKEYMPSDFAVREADMTVYPKTRKEEDYRWGLARFLDEARMLARFDDHPGIVRVQRFFEGHGTAYIVMEYVEGRTLGALYEAEKTLDESRLRTLLAPILAGLAQVHDAGFLHRDIKPANIMIRDDSTPVLIDFGAARAAIAGRSQSMTAIATPGFAPIEQYSAEGRQGPWTDIYAAGAVLYCGMTGAVPADAVYRAMNDDLLPAGQATAGGYSRSLVDAVDWALRLRGEDRPRTIEEWREVLEGRSTAPRHRSQGEPSWSAERQAAGGPAGTPVAAGAAVGATADPPRTGESPEPEKAGMGRRLAVLGVAAVLVVAGGAWWWDELARLGTAFAVRTGMMEDNSAREREARAEALGRLLKRCGEHMKSGRLPPALECFREVLALEPDHASARREVPILERLIAWGEAERAKSVERYFEFEQDHVGSRHAMLARSRLEELETQYWSDVVQAADTREAYVRYLEIYPQGRYAALARRRMSEGE